MYRSTRKEVSLVARNSERSRALLLNICVKNSGWLILTVNIITLLTYLAIPGLRLPSSVGDIGHDVTVVTAACRVTGPRGGQEAAKAPCSRRGCPQLGETGDFLEIFFGCNSKCDLSSIPSVSECRRACETRLRLSIGYPKYPQAI